MNEAPYLASEDSSLLRGAVESDSGVACLEIGAGNGGTLVSVSKNFQLVVGSDLVRPRMSDWSDAGANYVLADLAACFRDEAFDMVAFNPPYLPSDGVGDPAVDAGRENEVPLAFLREALRVVKESGTIVMLVSAESPIERMRAECNRRNFLLTRTYSRHLFYEELVVYRASSAVRETERAESTSEPSV
jgi:release factor glutamine methyltransferase